MVLMRNLSHRQFRVQLAHFLRKYRFSELLLDKLNRNSAVFRVRGKDGQLDSCHCKKMELGQGCAKLLIECRTPGPVEQVV